MSPIPLPAVLLLALQGGAPPADPDPGTWNSPEVLALVERGREQRSALEADGVLRSWRADVDGHVYFYLEPERGEPLLIRVDQVAVQLQWEAPDRFHQHIVGERREIRLPVRDFRYYMDRLTLVEHGFGDEIRIGGGLDVAGVPHPLAPPLPDTGEPAYDYRLGESLSLGLPGRTEPLRLREVEVRPRDPDRPGIIGVVTLEEGTGGIVRMAFLFTPASYVDRRTDRIAVEVDYGLWEGSHWLPNEQRIEVRREVPELDLGMGTVIRSVLRAGNYELNAPLPEGFAGFPPVTAASPSARASHAFREGLYDGMERDGVAGLRMETDLRALEAQAFELLGGHPPSGLSPLRLHLPRPSSVASYDRADGLVVGSGLSFRAGDRTRIRGTGGIAPGTGRMRASLSVDRAFRADLSIGATVRYRQPSDLGLLPGSDALLSSLGGALRGEDYRDPWMRTGLDIHLSALSRGSLSLRVHAGVEEARTPELARGEAPLDGARSMRPIRPVTDGRFTTLGAELTGALNAAGGRGAWELTLGGAHGKAGTGAGLGGELEARWGPATGARELRVTAAAWAWEGDSLAQGHRLLGGRGTLPGHPFRSFAGTRAASLSAEVSTDLGTPLLRLRSALHSGWTGGLDPVVAEAWEVRTTGAPRLSASAGIGLGWDLIRAEVARGLRGGEWQFLLSIDPRWWDRL